MAATKKSLGLVYLIHRMVKIDSDLFQFQKLLSQDQNKPKIELKITVH